MQGQVNRYSACPPAMANERRVARETLTRLGFLRGSAFLGHGDALQGELQAVAAELSALDELFDAGQGFGIAEFFAEFAEEGMDLRENEKHFAADGGLQKKFQVDGAAQRERRGHAPISAD